MIWPTHPHATCYPDSMTKPRTKPKSRTKAPQSPPSCEHASRLEPCWGDVRPAHGQHTCAGHYFVSLGGRYIAQGDRHHFADKVERMRSEVPPDLEAVATRDPKHVEDEGEG